MLVIHSIFLRLETEVQEMNCSRNLQRAPRDQAAAQTCSLWDDCAHLSAPPVPSPGANPLLTIHACEAALWSLLGWWRGSGVSAFLPQ